MAVVSTFTVVGGVTVTRIDSQDQFPLASGAPAVLRKANNPACGTALPADSPPANVITNTVADTSRFPTAALAAGVYRS